ncbi:hypothetical protein BKA70DRAFT_1474643 [Coprinopsis sp. MPI-PUGE-AT-0042]|nr:hypothetical protein BKA70DRAFT_1474643 [Coprinopsis sp. MPI-PUGE-AT-0042]
MEDAFLPEMRAMLELSLSQILDIFRLLTLTYPKYVDNLSRDAVEEVGMELVRRDELREEGRMGVTEQILGWLSNEVGGLVKRGTAKDYMARHGFPWRFQKGRHEQSNPHQSKVGDPVGGNGLSSDRGWMPPSFVDDPW